MWQLHRRVDLTALDPDPLDPGTTTPTYDSQIRVTKDQGILWVAIPMDSEDPVSAQRVAPGGLTIDGGLVLEELPSKLGRIRYPILTDNGGAEAEAGVPIEVQGLPQTWQGYIHIPAVTNPGVVLWAWIWWTVIPKV